MAKLLIYYAHPGDRHSHVNKIMAERAKGIAGIDFVDLYANYPRHDIDIDKEQRRLLEHDVILFQFPLFWYSTPSLIKEWQDLVLEYGFAYGDGGDALKGKIMMLAVTTGGPQSAYGPEGYQNHSLPTFLTPLQQTATLCLMHYAPPYVLFQALKTATQGALHPHVDGYQRLIEAIRDDRYDFDRAAELDCVFHDTLPIPEQVESAEALV